MRNYGQNINLNLVTYFGRFFHRSINRVNSVSRRNYVPFSIVDLNHFQTQTQSLKLSFTDFDSGHKELFVFYHWNLLKGSRFWYRLCRVLVGSLRSKGFRLVSGRPSEKWNGNQKMKEGGGGGEESIPISFFPTPSPLFCLRHFSRGLWLSFLVLCC